MIHFSVAVKLGLARTQQEEKWDNGCALIGVEIRRTHLPYLDELIYKYMSKWAVKNAQTNVEEWCFVAK